MTDSEAQSTKARCLADIRRAMTQPVYFERVAAIDPRLSEYIYFCIDPHEDHANLYELLGIRKFLRMLCTYDFDYGKIHKMFALFESFEIDSLRGTRRYPLTPMQCYQIAAPMGFVHTDSDGDPVRVCAEATLFVPRKSAKTHMAGLYIAWFFLAESRDCECYCTANSADQAKILYNTAQAMIRSLDRNERHIRFTATETNWKPGETRKAKVAALTAGGKTKDGLKAELCCADEYGSAAYVKDKSDMARLVGVVRGSMGARKQPLTLFTTTAGRVIEGPFEIRLREIKRVLERESDYPLDGTPRPTDDDWVFAQLCCPDPWELPDIETLMREPYMWRKVNHHLGITVQPKYYEDELRKMDVDPDYKTEQITKLFNVFQTAKTREWLRPQDITPLLQARRITDLCPDDDWVCFIGLDFSQGNDLNAVSYLCYNRDTGEFFADCDAWVAAEYVETSANATLYRQWQAAGWLHTCPGKVIDDDFVTARLEEIRQYVDIWRIGYDPYKAKMTVNNIRAWLANIGANPDTILRPVRQTFAYFTAPVDELTFLIHSTPPLIRFSDTSLWAWQFANCMIQESNDGLCNKKPVKAGNYETCKIDNVICLLEGLILYDEVNAQG